MNEPTKRQPKYCIVLLYNVCFLRITHLQRLARSISETVIRITRQPTHPFGDVIIRARPLRVYQGVLLIAATGISCCPMTRVCNDRSNCWKNQFFSTRCNTFYFHRFYWFGIRYLLLIVNIFLTSFNFTPYLSHLS